MNATQSHNVSAIEDDANVKCYNLSSFSHGALSILQHVASLHQFRLCYLVRVINLA